MHRSVMDFGITNLGVAEIASRRVLEVGSMDVNGILRHYIKRMKPNSYVGIDIKEGKGVDKVMNIQDALDHFEEKSFDIIICTEMLEHAEDYESAVKYMKRLCKGIILLTTRSRGFPYHNPPDYHRFTKGQIKELFSDFDIIKLEEDLQVPGVFLKARVR